MSGLQRGNEGFIIHQPTARSIYDNRAFRQQLDGPGT
jgi:hypothetical protein